MEVFIRNLPDQTTEKELTNFLREPLAKLKIDSYHCRKLRGRGLATLTILDAKKGQVFLQIYGDHRLLSGLMYSRRRLYCNASRNPPDQLLLRKLAKEENDRVHAPKPKPKKSSSDAPLQRKFDIQSLACGSWDYEKAHLVFVSYVKENYAGTLLFGKRSLILNISKGEIFGVSYQLSMPYFTVRSITTVNFPDSSVTISLSEAPRMYETAGDDLVKMLKVLTLKGRSNPTKRRRVTSIGGLDREHASKCLVYRIVLKQPGDINQIATLKSAREIPRSFPWPTDVLLPNTSLTEDISQLQSILSTDPKKFGLNFQLMKLSSNAYLPPRKVIGLVREALEICERSGIAIATDAVRRLSSQIPYPGPDTSPEDFGLQGLIGLMKRSEAQSKRERKYWIKFQRQNDHLTLVHRATVTPTGTYLYGPDFESGNRILRKYSEFSDFFLRVSFLDEDGEPIRFDRTASNEAVFHRFKDILKKSVNIAGRAYQFLGFSHSALRAQTCWFMAPFVYESKLHFAPMVIAKLGEFSAQRCPARCAARIGQAFTETFSAVPISSSAVEVVDDVERCGRMFSDGVGTFSSQVLRKILKQYGLNLPTKPRLYQIRYAGAKGMISLDSRLKGEVLRLRRSMIKFEGSDATEIEICGSASRPLPMYLNRQLIKILEDLGVPNFVFQDLQDKAVEQLRLSIQSNSNAAHFLEQKAVTEAAQLPWLLRKLDILGLPFQKDKFLCDTIELAVLTQLRELKHRSRIYVENAVTVYGIMDETGYLEEGEVYCSVLRSKNHKEVIEGPIVVTRSPALHPGDVQLAQAINVPASSPLKELYNCVIFSQKGDRDLPSQLSGGDLDGDLYNIIYDRGLMLKFRSKPADYPRVQPIDIGRPVERDDMAEFFIQFMENDQLGRIATIHQIIADQSPEGTLDGNCLTLANMHSTAVDFSKTGVPVDMSQLPKYSPCRPDFMATGPTVDILEGVHFKDLPENDDDSQRRESEMGDETFQCSYYESEKVLGQLYRAIKEKEFFQELQNQSKRAHSTDPGKGIMDAIWEYVQRRTAGFQWRHYTQEAIDIRETYEKNLIDHMYNYSTHPSFHLTELEVFVGNVIGKAGAQNKRQRENSMDMREKFDRDLHFIRDYIRYGSSEELHDPLERSIACLSLGVEQERRKWPKVGWLKSFGWVAAAVCLKEVERELG